MGKPLVLIDARKDNYLIATSALIAAREDAWLNAKKSTLNAHCEKICRGSCRELCKTSPHAATLLHAAQVIAFFDRKRKIV